MNISRFSVLCLITLGMSAPAYGTHEGRTHDEISNQTSANNWKARAERGEPMAQVKLGDIYNNGKNFREAVKWYRAASEQGDADGHASLGVMYDGGYGVPQDYQRAVYYYRLAAEQGDALSQYFLGISHMRGEGVSKDKVRAYMWFEIAAKNGLDDATHERQQIGKQMSSEAISEAKRLARQ